MTYGYPIDEDEQVSPLRRALMRTRYPMDERTPAGQSVDDLVRIAQRGNPISSAGGQGGAVGNMQPVPAQVAPQQSVRDVLLRKSAPATPQNPIPQAAAQADALPQQQQASQGLPDSAYPTTRRRIADPITYDEDYLRELETKRDPFWKRLAAAAIRGTQAATHQDIAPQGLTEHERDVLRVQGRLGRDVTLARARQQLEQNDLIPFQLPDGTWTQVPRKGAAVLGSRQQGQQATLSIRRQQMEAHNKRWDTMTKHEAAQDAQRLYNSGGADGNDDLKDEIIRRMGLPAGTRLPDHDKGQLATDDQGNFTVIDTRKAIGRPVMQPSETGRPRVIGSMQGTLEKGRNQRAAESQTQQNYRAGLRQGSAKAPTADRTALRRAAQLTGQIEATRKELEAFDSRNVGPDANGKRPPEVEARRKRITDKAAAAMTELNNLGAGYESGVGEGGYPYYKQSGGAPSSGRTLQGAIDAFKRATSRDPTSAEIENIKRGYGLQ